MRGARKERVIREAGSLKAALARAGRGMGIELLGPAPKPIARIQNTERWHILIRSGSRVAMQGFLKAALPAIRSPRPSGVRVVVDVDPRHVL